MQSYADFAEQAWLCAHYARTSRHDRVAEALWKTAQEYQRRAAELNSGVAPDIGDAPPDREKRVREIAIAIWKKEGRPDGHAERHWRMADAAV
jgi:hypothetical protein